MTTNKNAIANAIAQIPAIEADEHNDYDGYDYVSAKRILEIAGNAFAENNIVVVPSVTDSNVEYRGDQKKGFWLANLKMEMSIFIDGELFSSVQWVGSGVDYRVPDKAVWKAVTGGHRYFVSKLLMIAEGTEGLDSSVHQPARTEELPRKYDMPDQYGQDELPPGTQGDPEKQKAPADKTEKVRYDNGDLIQHLINDLQLFDNGIAAMKVMPQFQPHEAPFGVFVEKAKLYRQWKERFLSDDIEAKEATTLAIQKANQRTKPEEK
jgi:hypothetical protein